MALRKLERRNYGGKSPVSIKYQNLHTFKEGLILLSQSILETREITHLHGSAQFTIPLSLLTTMLSPKLLYFNVELNPYMQQKGFVYITCARLN